MTSSTIPQSSNNKFGRSIVIALPLGVFFCVVYPTTKFGTRIQISISSDGKTIELILPRQIPRNASDLLSGYPFAHDQHNIVYATVDAEIYRMKKEMNEWDTKVESTLLEFQEEMNPFFVDQLGNYTNTYESNEEEQRITFFVRTMASTRTMKGNSWCNNNHLPQVQSPLANRPTPEEQRGEHDLVNDMRAMSFGYGYSNGMTYSPYADGMYGQPTYVQNNTFPVQGRNVAPHHTGYGKDGATASEQRRPENARSGAAYHNNIATGGIGSKKEDNLARLHRLQKEMDELRALEQKNIPPKNTPTLIE